MSVIRNLANSYSRRHFAYLFCSLLITMAAAPVLSAMGINTRFMEILLAFNILAAALITPFRFRIYVGLGLFGLVVAARVGNALLGYQSLTETSLGIGALICLLAACSMIRFILSQGHVTSERIFAALDVYLLVGVMCGLLFCIFEEIWSDSFDFQDSFPPGGRQSPLAHTIYFSFVTLGTLGYGDITPIGGPARALAVVEAIGGQMYLVVVVARLVSLYEGRCVQSTNPDVDELRQKDTQSEAISES